MLRGAFVQRLSSTYLNIYIYKGPDHATLILEENLHIDDSIGIQHIINTDEIKMYLEYRYVSTIEVC